MGRAAGPNSGATARRAVSFNHELHRTKPAASPAGRVSISETLVVPWNVASAGSAGELEAVGQDSHEGILMTGAHDPREPKFRRSFLAGAISRGRWLVAGASLHVRPAR